MSDRRSATLARWTAIPGKLRRAIAPLSRRELAARGGSEGWSVTEYVHHLVEANLVASSIVLAALGNPGCDYDWSWLVPDAGWTKRLGYRRLPVDPAIRLLEALCAHVGGVLRGAPGGMRRLVRLRGSESVSRKTVEGVLREECDHAELHLRDLRAAAAKVRIRR
ncbi:MAG TPA: hypothetical protein VKH46_10055 [Thermoanaerobaculia bacterium]|jgi:hypothetical protein|nr:hypothetical protein [Thermoanaerobaculia bacterium]